MKFRGQESAPFEVLVAVILMTFVLVIGITALSKLQKAKCANEIDQEMHKLKDAIESTVNAGELQTKLFTFDLPFCGSEKYNFADWEYNYDQPSRCTKYCGISRNNCVLLHHVSFDEDASESGACSIGEYCGIIDVTLCLEINPFTTPASPQSNVCAEKERWTHIEVMTSSSHGAFETIGQVQKDFVRGTYLFQRVSGQDNPVICIYKQGDISESNRCQGHPDAICG